MFFSYLDGRTQSISIKDAMSVPVAVDCGVPQGSVIGPINFILFSAPLQDIIAAHGVQFVVYADDTQLYLTFQAQDREAALNKIESCIADIRSWCKSNMLVLNDKTEMLYFQSHFNRPTCHSLPTITIGNSIIRPSPQARNLGVTMDSLRMINHVNNLCKAAWHAIRKIGQIRQYLDEKSTTRLVHAFLHQGWIPAILCSSAFLTEIAKVQRVQNTAARLVLRIPRHVHITPVLHQLHWLPIKQRAAFKILLLTFKAIHGMIPHYISELVQLHLPPRILRSSSGCQLKAPAHSSTKFYGDRSFRFAAAHLWNSLPNSICQAQSLSIFKSRLKTYLFTQ